MRLRTTLHRVFWLTLGAASSALLFASLGHANHLGSLLLGHPSTANESTILSGNTPGGPELEITNTSSSPALKASSTSGRGVFGRHTSSSGVEPGVRGETASLSIGATGVYGSVEATSPGPTSAGVRAINNGTNANGFGLLASHVGNGIGVYGDTVGGTGVFGWHIGVDGTGPGVQGDTSSTSTDSSGVVGRVKPAVPGPGSAGVRGISAGKPKSGFTSGVRGDADQGVGVYGTTVSGTAGVYGLGNGNGTLLNGVWGHAQSGRGVRGTSPFGTGVSGESGTAIGVYGQTTSETKAAVKGVTLASITTAEGVHGEAQGGGTGVVGRSPVGSGVFGTTNAPRGVFTSLPAGVKGFSDGGGGAGVYGRAKFEAIGVFGFSAGGSGVVGQSGSGLAGEFLGDVLVTGTLTKGAGSFRIDHPLDPEHEFLQHSFVESPDMKNVYDGVVTTDRRGYATVRLPRWFQALNRDFRYQLTTIVRHADAWIGSEIARNRFTIRTDHPHVRVSWQVTGIRHDRYANAHRIRVVERKPDAEQGGYLHPELYSTKGTR